MSTTAATSAAIGSCFFVSGGLAVWNKLFGEEEKVTLAKGKSVFGALGELPHIVGEHLFGDMVDDSHMMIALMLFCISVVAVVVGLVCAVFFEHEKKAEGSATKDKALDSPSNDTNVNTPQKTTKVVTRTHHLYNLPRDIIEPAWFALKGIFYLLFHPHHLKTLAVPFVLSAIATVVSLKLFYTHAFGPQEHFLEESMGWSHELASSVAVIAVLAEVSMLNLLAFVILCKPTQARIYRAVLEEEDIFKTLKEAGLDDREGALDFLNASVTHMALFLLARLALMILTLPLNGYPVAGQIMWVVSNGWLYTWSLQSRFIKVLDEPELPFVFKHLVQFISFGAVAMSLELIPGAGPWVMFASNACGAAFLSKRIAEDTTEVKIEVKEHDN